MAYREGNRVVIEIERAVQLLQEGMLVAFPTETVYGLGADATNAGAVRRIFQAKGRPSTNPLICHVADASVARRYARVWPEVAERLAERFWPGPLTLVVPKNPVIVDEVTAGLQTVGLRAPDHALTLELLRAFDGAVAGPSANRSNHVSPTTAEHVREELGDRVDLILDGGPCRVGIESTVLDVTGGVPRILRPGGVSREQIEAIIGPVEMKAIMSSAAEAAPSPGQFDKHYSPKTPTYRYEDKLPVSGRDERYAHLGIGGDNILRLSARMVQLPDNPAAYARHLYATLREMDADNPEAIFVQMPPDEPAWAAVRDRLMRAAKPLP